MAALRPRATAEPSALEAFAGIAHPPLVQESTPVRAIVCAKQSPLRRGIAQCLRREEYVVDEATEVSGLAAAAALNNIDLIFVDDDLFDAVFATQITFPRSAKVVVVGRSTEARDVVRALDRGASGYLLSTVAAPALIAACRAVLAGGEVIDESLLTTLSRTAELQKRARRISRPDGAEVVLSPREYEVANRVKDGAPTREIADELGISVVTVRRHISTTMDKVGVASRESLRHLLSAA